MFRIFVYWACKFIHSARQCCQGHICLPHLRPLGVSNNPPVGFLKVDVSTSQVVAGFLPPKAMSDDDCEEKWSKWGSSNLSSICVKCEFTHLNWSFLAPGCAFLTAQLMHTLKVPLILKGTLWFVPCFITTFPHIVRLVPFFVFKTPIGSTWDMLHQHLNHLAADPRSAVYCIHCWFVAIGDRSVRRILWAWLLTMDLGLGLRLLQVSELVID